MRKILGGLALAAALVWGMAAHAQLVFGGGIAAASVTYSQIQNGVSTGLLGTNAGAAPSEVGIGTGLTLSGGVLTATGAGVGVQGGQSASNIGDNATALPAGSYYYNLNAALTAARSKNLPDSVTQGIGDIAVHDAVAAGGVSSTNTLTLCAAGSNTLNGVAAACTAAISTKYFWIGFHNDGAGNYTTSAAATLATSSAPSNQFANAITANGLGYAQPAFSNLSGAATVAQIGGSAASHAVPVDVAGTSTYKVVPDCTDTGGNHINFTQSTDAFSCGTSGGSGGGGTAATGNTTAVTVNANVTTDQLLQELHPANGAFNTSNMVIKLHQSGIYTVVATPQVTVKAKLCSGSNTGCITLASVQSAATITASNDQFVFEASCGVSATGATGTLTCHGAQLIDLTSGSVAATTYTDSNTAASATFDLTGANYIDFTIAFSSGSASNTATGQLAYVSPLGMGNGVTGSGTANAAAYFTGSTAVASGAAMTNGQLLIGSTSATPVNAALTAGTGVTITNGAGSVTVASAALLAGPSTPQAAFTTNTTLATINLPTITLAAKTYFCHGALPMTAAAAGGAKIALHGDGTLAFNTNTALMIGMGNNTANAAVAGAPSTSDIVVGLTNNGGAMFIDATLVVSTGGVLTITGAQNASSGTTTFLVGGYLKCTPTT